MAMTWFHRTARGARRRSDERGASAVEFAIIMPVLAYLLLGIIEYGYFFFAAQAASSGAREAARQLSVGNCTGSGEAQTYAQSQSFIGMTLQYGAPGNLDDTLPAVGQVLEVQVQADGKIVGFVPLPNNGAITQDVQAYVEDTTQGTCP
jgi:hypothetical protein